MYLLAIETTGAYASVALMKDGRIVGRLQGRDRFSHLQNLIPQIDAVVKDHKLSLGDLDAIAVSRGPGSFTGIRIGVSTARALSQALKIPCVPVPTLEALAMNPLLSPEAEAVDKTEAADLQPGGSDFADILICPILDARRSQVYGGGYFLRSGLPVEKIKGGAYTIEEFLSEAAAYHRILLLGDGSDACREKIQMLRPAGTETAPENIRYQQAVSVAKLGATLFQEQGGCGYQELKPEYMRLAEAERKLAERRAAERGEGTPDPAAGPAPAEQPAATGEGQEKGGL